MREGPLAPFIRESSPSTLEPRSPGWKLAPDRGASAPASRKLEPRYYAARRMPAHAAFLLHQAAERYFHAALLVFTGYKPQTHDLKKLADQTEPLHPALAAELDALAARFAKNPIR